MDFMNRQYVQVYDYVQLNDNYKRQRCQFRIPNFTVTSHYLRTHKNVYFIFGDNLVHRGRGGAAALRDEPNALGFVTKKYPNNNPDSFYKVDEYYEVFNKESSKYCELMSYYPNCFFLFSKLGSGLANKYCIFEKILEPWLLSLENKYPNCSILF